MNDKLVDDAVRDTLSPRATPYEGSWRAVAEQRPAIVGRRRMLRVAYPVMAALVVVAVMIGAAALRSPHASLPGLFFGDPKPNVGDTKAHHGPGRPATADAVAALNALAEVAATAIPAALAAGQYIYVHIDGQAVTYTGETRSSLGPQDRQIWIDPNGMGMVRLIADGQDLGVGGGAPLVNLAGSPAAPPSSSAIHPRTPAWIASWPTDPAALLAMLRAESDDTMTWSDDWQTFDRLRDLLTDADLIVPSAQRVTLYHALTNLAGLSVSTVTVGGRSLVALRESEANDVTEILFDPATGHAVGTRSLNFQTLDVDYVATWTQTVVNTTQATG